MAAIAPDSTPTLLEYIWIGAPYAGDLPSLRSKTKCVWDAEEEINEPGQCPDWNYDGSSTEQAPGSDSEVLLRAVAVFKDPFRGGKARLVLCEALHPETLEPVVGNNRTAAAKVAAATADEEPWYGIEQEYTMIDPSTGRPLGFPAHATAVPKPQGPYYCGVGAGRAFGRKVAEDHLQACITAGIRVSGLNAEVLSGQWEFQVGPVGLLEVGDQLWTARYILERVAESHGVVIDFSPKPVPVGDWNGSGAHTNFSTKSIRESKADDGDVVTDAIKLAMERMGAPGKPEEHLALYGAGNELRLTGKHETASMHDFKWGVADRGASIRIPRAGGYLEDRRPASNCDPYAVAAKIAATICGVEM
eukprot:PLAT11593.1.p1 GENE.PLAT11593.1~~PLAT11593.1.p1  ORF type:complete len:380 (+),score=165.41 PLAT11593.1:60-1142(+)